MEEEEGLGPVAVVAAGADISSYHIVNYEGLSLFLLSNFSSLVKNDKDMPIYIFQMEINQLLADFYLLFCYVRCRFLVPTFFVFLRLTKYLSLFI